MLRTLLAFLILGSALSFGDGAFGDDSNPALSRTRRVMVSAGMGRYRVVKPLREDDPVAALGEGDLKLISGGLNPGETKKLLEGYLDRLTAYHLGEGHFSEGLAAFLGEHPKVREVFVCAINPRYDDPAAAAKIFDALRIEDEKKLIRYVHLASALAVVHDTPDAAVMSRYHLLWAVEESQFEEMPGWKSVWDYYTQPKNVRRFGFDPANLPWTILVHLVDNDVPPEERLWALGKYRAKTSIGEVYSGVPYDNSKLARKGTRLGAKPYTFENLLQYGGVCVDQAQVASRVAKCLGIPAFKVSGHGRYGGAGHAWVGFMVIKGGRPKLEFAGRYFGDYYYTGDVYDPQTRTETLDRFVAMVYDGASLSYPKYNQCRMMVRMAEQIRGTHPKESLELTKAGLKLNYFNMWGWLLLMEHIKDGTVDRKTGLQWFNTMIRALVEHPDLTLECLNTFVSCAPEEDLRGRQSLYEQTFRIYAERPDLQLRLRMNQCRDLARSDMKLKTLNVLIPTIVANTREGKLVLPAVRMAVELAVELGLERQAHAMLSRGDAAFPKQRGSTPSAAYEEFRKLLDSLVK